MVGSWGVQSSLGDVDGRTMREWNGMEPRYLWLMERNEQ